jgi:hypothetical protein
LSALSGKKLDNIPGIIRVNISNLACVVRRALLNLQGNIPLYTYKTQFRIKKGLYMGNLNLSAEGVKTQNISSRMIRLTDRTVIIRNKFHIPAYLLWQILPSDLWHPHAVAQLLLFHF